MSTVPVRARQRQLSTEIFMKALVLSLLATGTLSVAFPAMAQEPDHAAHHPVAADSEPAIPVVDGMVRKVDKDAGKITLKHGPIPNIGMPDMSMVFRVKDPAMVEQVKAGDKVRFSAEKIDGLYTITFLERVE